MTETIDRQAAFSGTMEVREKHRFDIAALEAYMVEHVTGYTPGVSVAQFKGGQSNPTYKLTDGAGRTYVLRRKPPGNIFKSAHAVDREYRVITGLARADVPVAKTYALCEDESVIGTWFYIMECVEGRILWDPLLPGMTRQERRAIYDGMNDGIARLHNADYESVGLGDYGKPGSYFERQIGRWGQQYEADKDIAGAMPAMERLIEWLPENMPASSGTSVVHGDYRIDNMIFHPTEPTVLAILDWELSTLGDPLSDFAYHCMGWRGTSADGKGLMDHDLESLGIPTEAEYIAAYCARTGRDGIADMDFYLAFNMFRLAGICHGIMGRVRKGSATSKQAEIQGAAAAGLAEAGWVQAERAMAARD